MGEIGMMRFDGGHGYDERCGARRRGLRKTFGIEMRLVR